MIIAFTIFDEYLSKMRRINNIRCADDPRKNLQTIMMNHKEKKKEILRKIFDSVKCQEDVYDD
jgi:hypothetical protein